MQLQQFGIAPVGIVVNAHHPDNIPVNMLECLFNIFIVCRAKFNLDVIEAFTIIIVYRGGFSL